MYGTRTIINWWQWTSTTTNATTDETKVRIEQSCSSSFTWIISASSYCIWCAKNVSVVSADVSCSSAYCSDRIKPVGKESRTTPGKGLSVWILPLFLIHHCRFELRRFLRGINSILLCNTPRCLSRQHRWFNSMRIEGFFYCELLTNVKWMKCPGSVPNACYNFIYFPDPKEIASAAQRVVFFLPAIASIGQTKAQVQSGQYFPSFFVWGLEKLHKYPVVLAWFEPDFSWFVRVGQFFESCRVFFALWRWKTFCKVLFELCWVLRKKPIRITVLWIPWQQHLFSCTGGSCFYIPKRNTKWNSLEFFNFILSGQISIAEKADEFVRDFQWNKWEFGLTIFE